MWGGSEFLHLVGIARSIRFHFAFYFLDELFLCGSCAESEKAET